MKLRNYLRSYMYRKLPAIGNCKQFWIFDCLGNHEIVLSNKSAYLKMIFNKVDETKAVSQQTMEKYCFNIFIKFLDSI